MIDACAQLPVDLDIVEGVPHEEARARYARADIVVDQLNAGWHGVFALESMALGKPVVTYLKPDVVERSAEGFGVRIPIVPATKETLVEALRPLVEQPALRREIGAAEPRLRRAGARHRPRGRPPPRPLPFSLVEPRLPDAAPRAPLGDLRRRRARVADPRDDPAAALPHYLPPVARTGEVEIITAATAVLAIVLQLGIASAFFRFYFDAKENAAKLTVIRTSFWFTMGAATLGLVVGLAFAPQISHLLGLGDAAVARARRRGRPLGADELPAADRALPRRGAVDRLRDRERHERARHRRGDGALRRRLPLGRDRARRRQLHRDARRLPRARPLPHGAARARVRQRPASGACRSSACRSCRRRSRCG